MPDKLIRREPENNLSEVRSETVRSVNQYIMWLLFYNSDRVSKILCLALSTAPSVTLVLTSQRTAELMPDSHQLL
jgi:hypothetical protein